MKKLIIAVLMLLTVSPAFASQNVETVIDDVTLRKGSATDDGVSLISDSEKVAFFVTYDSSRTTAAVTATVSAQVSYDGINWTTASWFDVSGGVTPQTSETLSTDTTYMGWLDSRILAQQLKITVTLDNANVYGTGDTADVTAVIIDKK